MPFTMPNYPMLSAEQINPYHAALQTALQGYGQALKTAYLPLTTEAEAASKIAYAKLMGPQFIAKLMGNRDILANIPEGQKDTALQTLLRSGMGLTGSSSGFQSLFPSLSRMSNVQQIPTTERTSVQGIGIEKPIEPIRQQPETMSETGTEEIPSTTMQKKIGEAARAWLQGSEAKQQAEKQGYPSLPDDNALLKWYDEQSPQKKETFAEKTGKYAGVVAEEEEAGKIRAKDIQELNQIAFDARTSQTTLDRIGNIVNSPVMEQIRQFPIGGHLELSYYSRFGTPEQKNTVGQLTSSLNKFVADDAKIFKGSFRTGEQDLLFSMKPAEGDTIDTIKGKLESLMYFNNILRTRAQTTSKLMHERHISKGDAEQLVDSMIDPEVVSRAIHDRLNPMVEIVNQKTGERKKVSATEARKMGVRNV